MRRRPISFDLLAAAAAIFAVVACGPSQEGQTPGGGGGVVLGDDVLAQDVAGTKDGSGGGKLPPCGTDADCELQLVTEGCERARCLAGKCVLGTALDGESCQDGDACTLEDRCLGGTCLPGSPRVCDDDNPCTADSCAPADGACVAVPVDGACPAGGGCALGVCKAGSCAVVDAYPSVDLAGDATVATRGVAVGSQRLLVVSGPVGSPFSPRPFAGAMHWLDRAGVPVATLPTAATRLDDAVALPDGGFVLVGALPQQATMTAPGDLSDGALVRTDAQGTVLWTVGYGTPARDALVAVDRRGDGGLVAVGARHIAHDGEPGLAEGWLLLLTAGGQITLDYHYASPQPLLLRDVAAVGNAAVVAGWQQVDAGHRAGLLMRVGAGAGIEKVRQLGVGAAAVAVLYDAAHGRVVAALAPDPGGDGAGAVWVGDLELETLAKVSTAPLHVGADRFVPVGLQPAVGGWRLVGTRGAGTTLVAGLGPFAALQWWREVPTLSGPAWVASDAGALWLAGAAPSTSAPRLCRVDGFGYSACTTAGACAAEAATGCDDGDPCSADSCEPIAGCVHDALGDGTVCGVAKTCALGVCP